MVARGGVRSDSENRGIHQPVSDKLGVDDETFRLTMRQKLHAYSLVLTLMVFCSHAGADVGFVAVKKNNQVQRSADRFAISVDSRPPQTMTIQVKPRRGERFTKAELEVTEANQPLARIPVRAVVQRDRSHSIELTLAPSFARTSRLNVLIDSTDASVGTVYGIELGSYLTHESAAP